MAYSHKRFSLVVEVNCTLQIQTVESFLTTQGFLIFKRSIFTYIYKLYIIYKLDLIGILKQGHLLPFNLNLKGFISNIKILMKCSDLLDDRNIKHLIV